MEDFDPGVRIRVLRSAPPTLKRGWGLKDQRWYTSWVDIACEVLVAASSCGLAELAVFYGVFLLCYGKYLSFPLL